MTSEVKLIGGSVAAVAVVVGAVLLAPTGQPAVTAWPMLCAAWDSAPCHGFNVYHGTNLDRRTWVKIGTTTNNFYWFQSAQFGFVGVKSFYRVGTNELESPWALAAQSK